jgi:hypothetical protein
MLIVIILSIFMLSVIMLIVIILSIFILSVIMLIVIILSIFMLSVIMLSVIMLSVIMLSVIMLNVLMLSVIMLSVAAPRVINGIKLFFLDNRCSNQNKLECLEIILMLVNLTKVLKDQEVLSLTHCHKDKIENNRQWQTL